MKRITLTREQAEIIRSTDGPVEVRDEQGQIVASFRRITAQDLEAVEHWKKLRENPNRVRIPASLVQERLKRLEEIAPEGPMDEATALEVIRQVRAEDAAP